MEETTAVKILILGTGSVGKTALACRFTQDLALEGESRIIQEPLYKTTKIEETEIKIEIFHYIGPEGWATREMLLRSCDAIILMYSVIATSTYNDIPDFHDDVLLTREGVPMLLVGNKQDLGDGELRTVTTDQGKHLAERLSMGFYEISAKTNYNVNDLFYDLIRQVMTARSAKSKSKKGAKHKGRKDCKID